MKLTSNSRYYVQTLYNLMILGTWLLHMMAEQFNMLKMDWEFEDVSSLFNLNYFFKLIWQGKQNY